MAVLQRVSFQPNERLDTPDIRAIEGFGLNDWRFFLSGFMSSKSMVLAGFEIANYSTIFTVPGFNLTLNDVVLLHTQATTQAAGFYVFAGTEQTSQLSLAPSATNFIEVDFTDVTGTPDVRAFWDQGADGGKGAEFIDTVNTVINLQLNVTSNITGFTAGKIPLYKAVTDSSGVVTSVTDCRNLLFRLGTGGDSPNPSNNFSWPNVPDAAHSRAETAITATSATANNQPFQGGDKNLKTFKDWLDAVMTSLKEIRGSSYWYQASGVASVPTAYQNAALTLFTGGEWQHVPSPSPVGHLALIGASTVHRLGFTNNVVLSAFSDIDLTTNTAFYILLPSSDTAVTYGFGQNGTSPIVPKAVSSVTATSITVALGGNYTTAGGNILVRNQKFSYTSFTPGTGLFAGVTPDPSGLVQSGDFAYQLETGATAYYHTSIGSSVPGVLGLVSMGAERVMWLAFYNGSDTIELKNADMLQGEAIKVGDETSQNIISYIGAPDDATSNPTYTSNIRGVSTNSLTARAGVLTDAAGDEQEDRSSYLRSATAVTWTGTSLSFASDLILELINTKSGTLTAHTILAAGSPIALADGESAWVRVVRTSASENVTVHLSGTLAIPPQTQADKDVFVIARRVGADVWIPLNKQLISSGATTFLGQSPSAAVSTVPLEDTFAAGFRDFVSTSAHTISPTTTPGAPAAGFFYSQILGRASIPDPSKNLKPNIGPDVFKFNQGFILLGETEIGTGRPVYGATNDRGDIVRATGTADFNPSPNIFGPSLDLGPNDVLEFVMYGTDAYVLAAFNAADSDLRVSIDGGVYGSNITPTSASGVIDGFGYGSNRRLLAASGLTLGNHTISIKNFHATNGAPLTGFEMINNSSLVKTTPNVGYASGKEIVLAALDSTSYSSSVTGTRGGRVLKYLGTDAAIHDAFTPSGAATQIPVREVTTITTVADVASSLQNLHFFINEAVGGPGGYVWMNVGGGGVDPGPFGDRTSIAATIVANSSAINVALALATAINGFSDRWAASPAGNVVTVTNVVHGDCLDFTAENSTFTVLTTVQGVTPSHLNEEEVLFLIPSDFSAGNANDFTYLESAPTSDSAFTLDDNATSLTAFGGGMGLFTMTQTRVLTLTADNDELTLTWTGTGLDIVQQDSNAGSNTVIRVDNDDAGGFAFFLPRVGNTNLRRVPLISGLPYQTHITRIKRLSASSAWNFGVAGFAVYQPKTPSLPTGAVHSGAFNVPANFVANPFVDNAFSLLSTGVVRHTALREAVYTGGGWSNTLAVSTANALTGYVISTSTAGNKVTFRFWGQAFDFRWISKVGADTGVVLGLDGSNDFTGVTWTRYGGTSFTQGTGTLNTNTGASTNLGGFTVEGLTLGLHEFTATASGVGDFEPVAIDVWAPVHSYKINEPNTFGPALLIGSQGVEDQRNFTPIITDVPSPWTDTPNNPNRQVLLSTGTTFQPIQSTLVKVRAPRKGRLKMACHLSIANDSASADLIALQFGVDGVIVGQEVLVHLQASGAGTFEVIASASAMVPAAPGDHTVVLYIKSLAGGTFTTTDAGTGNTTVEFIAD